MAAAQQVADRSPRVAAQQVADRSPRVAIDGLADLQTGSFGFGSGVNSDAGLAGSIVLNERNFNALDNRVHLDMAEFYRRTGHPKAAAFYDRLAGQSDDNRVRPAKATTSNAEYKSIFRETLGVMADHFESITSANQYAGRIETSSTPAGPAGKFRQGIVTLSCNDGTCSLTLRVNIVKITEGKPEVVGRDTELERKLLAILTPRA